MNNIAYLLALHSIEGLGPIRLKAILDYFKDPKLAWETNENQLIEIGIPKNAIQNLVSVRKSLSPEEFVNSIEKLGIKWITIFDEGYPKLLKEIYDPPVVLYYKGDPSVFNTKCIAVVGTRKMTGYGKIVTEKFISGLVGANLTIVSGLARGVDSEAHKRTIKETGKTIAVLGGGLKNIYPPENNSLAEQIILSSGIILSEFSPDNPSFPGNFPARNRIISGLSLGVLVIEAAADSGSLITARLSLEQGREVFAVPGPITSDLSKGPISLINEGARAVMEPEEILEELGIRQAQGAKFKAQSTNELSEEEKKILEVLGQEQMHIDQICRKLTLTIAKVSATLLKMEIVGLVKNLGGGTYCKA